MENPIKMDDLGVPLFLETSTSNATMPKQLQKKVYKLDLWNIYIYPTQDAIVFSNEGLGWNFPSINMS